MYLQFIDKNFFSIKKLFKREKIIIYPNLNGFILSVFVFFCFLISIFYENNLGLLISIIIFFIFFISIIVSNQNLSDIEIIGNDFQLIETNQNSLINIKILNNSEVEKLNINFFVDKKNKGNFNLKPNQNKINLNYNLKNRGILILKDLYIKSEFPFGIIKTKKKFNLNKKIYIYPKPINYELNLISNFDKLNVSKNENEFFGIDEYKLGDNLSKIAWKKSIIQKKKFVKIFESMDSLDEQIFDLDSYKNINFERLLGFTSYLFIKSFKLKRKIVFKHKKKIIRLSEKKSSLEEILKYISNV